ncbi:MAG: PSD1 and planctomycete cytochrome C domain-containing protein [Pirellulaceae bacterium]
MNDLRFWAAAVGPIAVLLLSWTVCRGQTPAEDPEAYFRETVQPILAKRCWDCHGADDPESGLRLDALASLQAGGESGQPVVVAGQPEESYLMEVLRHDGDVAMPPDNKLPDEEIQALVEWVRMGLPWPATDAQASGEPSAKAIARAQQEQSHWAFQPLVAPAPPAVLHEAWIAQPLDRFILAHLESHALAPSPQADRYTLIRRLKIDLVGLPPTHDEVQAYLTDTSPHAYEQLVERYLSSPHYGERWGRHWLDVARYADTRGYAFERERRYPYAYTYRDYVIRALNEDLPFDRFVLEQLAADLLSPEANDPALAALGFLTVGRKYNNRHLDIDDQIDVVGRGLLGLTVACARCHDHKYDPVPTDDYYSLYGVFASSEEPNDLPTVGDPTLVPGYEAFQEELARLQGDLDAFKRRKRDELVTSARQHATDYLVRAVTKEPEESLQQLPFIALKGEDFRPRLVRRWQEFLAQTAKADHPVLGPLSELLLLPDPEFPEKSAEILARWKTVPPGTRAGELNPLVSAALENSDLQTKLDVARAYGQLLSDIHAASESVPASPSDTSAVDPARQILDILVGPGSLTDITIEEVPKLLTRAEGNEYRELERKVQAYQVDAPGAPPRAMIVRENPTPHTPRIFVRGNHDRPGEEVPRQFLRVLAGENRQPFQQGSGRLELAQSIVAPENPLTARVIVNRVWMHHFGSPLVTSPSDFGLRCERPVQLDTLDHLAAQFVSEGWSLKKLHRHIVLSNTYRQASLPREECEQVDPENALYGRANRRRLEFEALRDATLSVSGELDMTAGGRPVDLTKEPFSLRRAIYGYVDRQDLPGLFRVFDLASPDQSCPQRPRTTVPQQALFLMNSPFVMERAKTIAARPELTAAATTAERIDAMYKLIFARAPSQEEIQIGEAFLDVDAPADRSDPLNAPWQQYAHLLMMSNAFVFVD